MQGAVKINSNSRFKQEHVESCPSTIKNFKYPLPKCLGLSKLAGW